MGLELLSTTLDTLDLVPQLFDEDASKWVRTLTEVRNSIYLQDGFLRSALRDKYGEDLTIDPWASFPIPDESNQGDSNLTAITVSNDGITEVWTLAFTSATDYTIEGDISGSQGTGKTNLDSSSTNGYVTIPAANWSGTPQSGDKINIRTYNIEPAIIELSSKFTAAYLLSTIYTQEVPNASEAAELWKTNAQGKLEKYLDPTDPSELEIGYIGRDLSTIQVLPKYIISDLGEDESDYATGVD